MSQDYRHYRRRHILKTSNSGDLDDDLDSDDDDLEDGVDDESSDDDTSGNDASDSSGDDKNVDDGSESSDDRASGDTSSEGALAIFNIPDDNLAHGLGFADFHFMEEDSFGKIKQRISMHQSSGNLSKMGVDPRASNPPSKWDLLNYIPFLLSSHIAIRYPDSMRHQPPIVTLEEIQNAKDLYPHIMGGCKILEINTSTVLKVPMVQVGEAEALCLLRKRTFQEFYCPTAGKLIQDWRQIEGPLFGSIDSGPCEDVLFQRSWDAKSRRYGPFLTRNEFNQGVVEALRYSRPNAQLTKRDEPLVQRILASGGRDERKLLTHGDLHQSNIIESGDTTTGIIDWGASGYIHLRVEAQPTSRVPARILLQRTPETTPFNAQVVIALIDKRLSSKTPEHIPFWPENFCILTFYSAQESLIRTEMSRLHWAKPQLRVDSVKIATVDKYQGHEADIVILDMVVVADKGFVDTASGL
ncbi:protein kinase-like protein [Penicillium malachiteum]|nr:protein kinase-like protein [Penicillium malachiteum]